MKHPRFRKNQHILYLGKVENKSNFLPWFLANVIAKNALPQCVYLHDACWSLGAWALFSSCLIGLAKPCNTHIEHSLMYNLNRTLYSVHSQLNATLYTLYKTLWIVQSAMYNLFCRLCTVQCTLCTPTTPSFWCVAGVGGRTFFCVQVGVLQNKGNCGNQKF